MKHRPVPSTSCDLLIYASTKIKVATSNGLGNDTITRNVTGGQAYGQTDDFGTKLIYHFFLTKERV